MADEAPAIRLRRLRLRSWRRGMREMDLILGRFADAALDGLAPEAVASYEALLGESDQDLYPWISGQAVPPAQYAPIITEIQTYHRINQRSG